MGTSYAALKAHNWFDDFDWDKLFSHELTPPVINLFNLVYAS
jgi:cGMP-dependent protein kinase